MSHQGIRDDVPVAADNRWLFGVCAVGSPRLAVSGALLRAETDTPGRWLMVSCAHNFDRRGQRALWQPRDVFPGLNHGRDRVRLRSVEGVIHPKYKSGRSDFDISLSLVVAQDQEWREQSELWVPDHRTQEPREGTFCGYPLTELRDDPATPAADPTLRMMALRTGVRAVRPVLLTARDSEPGYSGGPLVIGDARSGRLVVAGIISRKGVVGGECCSLFNTDVRLWIKATAGGWGFKV